MKSMKAYSWFERTVVDTMWAFNKIEGLLMVCMLSCINGKGELDHRGTRFIIGFLDTNSTLNPEILVILQEDEPVNVTVSMPLDPTFNPIYKVINDTQAVTSIELPDLVRMTRHQVGQEGILVEATSDIVVYAINRANGTSDAFLALPTDALGSEYYVASYRPLGKGDHVSQIGILGTAPKTRVTVTIPGNLNRSILMWYGDTVCHDGDTVNVTLDTYQTVQLESLADLTGVRIHASAPVGVLSGDTAASVAAQDGDGGSGDGGTLWQDHLVEQLAPTRSWGRTFATVPFADTTNDVFRIVASQNDTGVKVKKRSGCEEFALSESQHAEVNVSHNDFINIEASKPVLVLQYLITELSPTRNRADAFMLLVPPMEQREHQYLFSTVHPGGRVNLVISDAMRDGLLLDGELIENTSARLIVIEGFHANYSAVRLSVNGGRHNLSHYSREALFAAMSYGYPLGMRLHDLAALKETPPMTYTSQSGLRRMSTTSSTRKTFKTTAPATTAGAGTVKVITNREAINRDNGINEAMAQPNGFSASSEPISPTVIAVIVSLSAAVFFVIVCIVGFLVAEFVCRREEGFRTAKVAPLYTN